MKKVFLFNSILFLVGILSSACGRSEATAVNAPSNAAKGSANSAPAAAPQRQAANDLIRYLEDRVRRDPEDFISLNKLAGQYLLQLRETGDLAYLDLASRAANQSLGVLPPEQNRGAFALLAQTQFSSHEFEKARENALKLDKLDPDKSYVYQMLGDAQLELGQYDEAEASYKKMRDLGWIGNEMSVAVEQRNARLAMLHGDLAASARSFEAALKAAKSGVEPPREPIAWCQWQLGETAFLAGDLARAEKFYRESLQTFPNYYRSVASLGRVLAAKGDTAGGIAQFEQAVKLIPDPNYVASLGDLYKVAGRDSDAQNQYTLVEQIGRLSVVNGTLYNRQLAMFWADHDLKPDEAYQNAAKEYEVRKDVFGADAVAWTALKAGKLPEAQAAIKEATKLGTKDARIFFHAGMIAKAAGDNAEAVRFLEMALKQNPAFDPLLAPAAKAELTGLRRGR